MVCLCLHAEVDAMMLRREQPCRKFFAESQLAEAVCCTLNECPNVFRRSLCFIRYCRYVCWAVHEGVDHRIGGKECFQFPVSFL